MVSLIGAPYWLENYKYGCFWNVKRSSLPEKSQPRVLGSQGETQCSSATETLARLIQHTKPHIIDFIDQLHASWTFKFEATNG